MSNMNNNWEIRYRCINSDEDGCQTDWRDFKTEKEAIEFINGEGNSLESFELFPGLMQELENLSL